MGRNLRVVDNVMKAAILHKGPNGCLIVVGINQWEEDLSTPLKKKIESYWRTNLQDVLFDENSEKQKHYVLTMFPYPSGQLHMGHVRVYSISDAIARFHRLRGQNVFHPMGWDAFGLPADNAARDRGVDPESWTQSNITAMKDQMEMMNLSFDWSRELATCDADYYKWTQYLFLKLLEKDLVYQKEALVNWDPVDKTVLADEQVDPSGRSWRSGAKVEKKKFKQWFIRTTRFAKDLYEGLDNPKLKDWRDIVKIQKHWIGECSGTTFDLEVIPGGSKLTVWTKQPEFIDQAKFIGVKPKSIWDTPSPIQVKNPFTTDTLPVFVTDQLDYPEGCDTYLGLPEVCEKDKIFAESVGLNPSKSQKTVMGEDELLEYRQKILTDARKRGIGGYYTSSKLRDWLISRQRYWGTPIPVVYCKNCQGPQPVRESDLPVTLPSLKKDKQFVLNPLEAKDWQSTTCPSCGGEARRETDTMDTFVDSSWYFLRFLDPDNNSVPFDPQKMKKFMPVDVYVGGKEHAVLHLYYARFFGYFLHELGALPHPEPFLRLLVQGMVKGQTFRVKGSGEYLKPNMVVMKDGKAVHRDTNEPLVVSWEKMSKSKFNGVDPKEMFDEFGCDTTRLIILADVAPTSSRNWSRDTFPGILNWQRRLWITVQEFRKLRDYPPESTIEREKSFDEHEQYLWDSRNFYVKGVTFNFIESYQISVAISKMQGLTNSLRKCPPEVVAFGKEYEKALAAQIIMLAPVAPHFASELWAGFVSAKRRISADILWEKPLAQQPWPKVDATYPLTLTVSVNNEDIAEITIPKVDFDMMRHEEALQKARKHSSVFKLLSNSNILRTSFRMYKDCRAVLRIQTDSATKIEVPKEERLAKKQKQKN